MLIRLHGQEAGADTSAAVPMEVAAEAEPPKSPKTETEVQETLSTGCSCP